MAMTAALLLGLLTGALQPAGQEGVSEQDLIRDVEELGKSVLTATRERIADAHLQGRAEILARKHGAKRASFLAEQVVSQKRQECKEVAALILANLAGDQTAETVLLQLASEGSRIDVRLNVIGALAFIDPQRSRAVLRKLIAESRQDAAHQAFLELLCIAGNQDSRDFLGGLQAANRIPAVQATLRSWLPILDHKLTLKEKEQVTAWESEGCAYWRACFQAKQMSFHSALETLADAATRISSQIPRISATFLDLRVKAEDPVVPAVFAGLNKEGELLALSDHLPKDGRWGDAVRAAMRELGTGPVVRAVEKAVPAAANSRIRRELTGLLAVRGDAKSADLLQQWSEDAVYDADAREHFRSSRDTLLERLKQRRP